jgi:glucokinase
MMPLALVPDLHAERAPGPLLTVGIDVGGTKTACVVTDAQDQVLLHEVQPTEATRLPDQLTTMIRHAVETVTVSTGGTVTAVGVAVPGRVEPSGGTFALAVNLGGEAVVLGPELAGRVGLPCYVEHDAASAAEWVRLANAQWEKANLAYVSVGTGISAGIVLDGEIFRGENGLAGEIGHVTAEPDGSPCACGLHGCLEATCTGPAIARLARDAAARGRETVLDENATAADIFHAAARGDPLAEEIVSRVSGHLARAIRGLLFTLGIRHIVIGGGVAAAGEDLLSPLLAAIASERAASALAETAFAHTTIELLAPDVEAGARGVAAIARERAEADQREGVGKR